jgi:ABC-type uncharacterized transport system substrate-binding protein
MASSAATGGLGESLAAAGLSAAQITALAALAGVASVAAIVEVTKDDDGNAVVTATTTTGETVTATVTGGPAPVAISGS